MGMYCSVCGEYSVYIVYSPDQTTPKNNEKLPVQKDIKRISKLCLPNILA